MKAKVKSGMLAKYRDGKKCLVVDTDIHGLIFRHENGYMPLSEYNDELICSGCSNYDIMELGTTEAYGARLNDMRYKKTLFKRENYSVKEAKLRIEIREAIENNVYISDVVDDIVKLFKEDK